MDFIQIEDNLWKKKRKNSDRYDFFVKSNCRYCKNSFLQYRTRTTNFCSRSCFSLSENDYSLNGTSIEIMNGLLLSDGCLQYRNDSLNAAFSQSCKHYEYLEYIKNQFSFPCKISSYNYIDKRWNKKIYANQLTTKQSKLFNDLYIKWYPKDKKEIPTDILLTPITILHWFLGDGYGGKKSINFCTECFSKDSIDFLLAEFKKLGFNAIPTKRNKGQRIYLPTKYQIEFLELIGKSPVACYDYKWECSKNTSYFNRICVFCGIKFNAKNCNKLYCSSKCVQKMFRA